MTTFLEKAFQAAQQLPINLQDELAQQLLEDINDILVSRSREAEETVSWDDLETPESAQLKNTPSPMP
ncbi:MAG: hypothetical protein ACHWZW_13915 [Spirulina sp.]